MKELIRELIEMVNCPDGLFTDRNWKIVLRGIISKYEHQPHIICLAAAKHYRLRPAMTERKWIISLVKIGDRKDKYVASGETYWEAEKMARNFLEGPK